jgi:hypothetical protein
MMEIDPLTEVWKLRDTLNTPNFMRMKDGKPQAKLYVIVAGDDREIAEVWINVEGPTNAMLKRVQREGVLMSYAPMMFWALQQFKKATETPDGIREITDILLKAIEESRADAKSVQKEGNDVPASEAVQSGE